MTPNSNKSLVFYRVFFALIMCRYLQWFCTIHETTIKHFSDLHFCRKVIIFVYSIVFSRVFFARLKRRYLRCFRAYTKHRENTSTFAQSNVILYKSLVFSRVFFALIIYRFLPCFRSLRKTTMKHYHICQNIVILRRFVNLEGRCICMQKHVGRNEFFETQKTHKNNRDLVYK